MKANTETLENFFAGMMQIHDKVARKLAKKFKITMAEVYTRWDAYHEG